MQPSLRSIGSAVAHCLSLLLILSLACGEGDNPGEPAPAGAIHVTTITSGDAQDPDGYALLLDGTEVGPVGLNADTTLGAVAPGSRTLALVRVTPNCTIEGKSFRNLIVQAGGTAEARFVVTCAAPTPAAAWRSR